MKVREMLCLTFGSVILLGLACGAIGCMGGKPPPAVIEAQDLKRAAIANYAGNNEQVVATLLELLRRAEYRRIDALGAIDVEKARLNVQKAGGKFTFDQAFAFMAKQDRDREIDRAKADTQVSRIRATVARARQDLALSLKLDEILAQYANAGVDLTAARSAIDEILKIVERSRGPAPAPPPPARGP